ncbi:MAG TPA: efflux RND transporter periplasmic adaptor subunit [Candidatus Acidoferrum sp.]|nr:efflux RND transporter periplasmic adaptor subunit [Candidatus Acidoferrum sp.]
MRLHGTARRFTLPVCCAAAFALVAAGCGHEAKDADPVVSVQVTPAHRETISQIVSTEAVVFPLQQAVITPKITSTIKEFLVQRGSHVKKDQLLAILENADLSAAAEQSKGDFEQAEAGYVTTTNASLPQQIQKAELDAASFKAAFDAQQKVYDSRKQLYQQGALPRKDLDTAEVALSQARAQYEEAQRQLEDLRRVGKEQTLKSASGQLASAKGKYLGAQAQLSYSQIRSPIDGVVTDRPLYPGELATANQPLLTVMNTSTLIAKAHIAQSQAALLKTGDPASILIPGTEKEVAARVSLISPALDPGSTTLEVWIETNRPPAELRPGMTVRVDITAKTAKEAIVIPSTALFHNPEGGAYVLLAGADGTAHIKSVEPGVVGATQVAITSGLNVNDPVITSGGYALPEGTHIKIEKLQTADSASPGTDSKDESAGKAPAKDASAAKPQD